MRIIQISGKGRVGKTTLAKLIAKHCIDLGYIPAMVPFAQAIKDAALAEGFTKEANSEQYRKFCQDMGADKRKADEDYWVTKTYNTIQEYMVKEINNKVENKTNFEYVLIQDDVRFMNEIAFGRELSATQIFLHSAGRILPEHFATWRSHESEVLGNSIELSVNNYKQSEFDSLFDVVINNNGTEVQLEKMVKTCLTEWLSYGYIELEEYTGLDEDYKGPEYDDDETP